MDLAGRVALVTGASRGVGAAIARGLAADGADIAVNYRRDHDHAAATVAAVEALGRRAHAYPASIDDDDADRAMVDAVLADFGHVDILVHNAGIASRGHRVLDTDPAELERVWRIHAYGAFLLTQLVLPSMRTRPRGDVIMISSVAAAVMAGYSLPYNVAKASLEALARTLAKEERRHNIHVNTVAPGLVVSDMGRRLVRATQGVDDIHQLDDQAPFGHVCTPDEVADAVRFLVSDRAAYLTDQRLTVDGGNF